jgi:hypothetical protein
MRQSGIVGDEGQGHASSMNPYDRIVALIKSIYSALKHILLSALDRVGSPSMYVWLPLTSSKDLQLLEKHISPEYAPTVVASKLIAGISNAVKGVLIEHNYIDKDYRSTYYHFYSKKGQFYRTDCVRLHFFDGTVSFDNVGLTLKWPGDRLEDHYFGYMVLRPIGVRTIGRSVFSPDVRSGVKGGAQIVTARHKVHILGHKISVEGFPAMDQHIDISVCAHAACWSVLRHYSERYSTSREYLTHDITMMAQQFDPGGLVPSKGLEISSAERVFQAAGTYPYLIATRNKDPAKDPAFYRQLVAYVQSGFPLFAAMHKHGHAIAVIGYEWDPTPKLASNGLLYAWDLVNSLIVVDDKYLPYLSVPLATPSLISGYSVQDIDSFIVALPEKIFYPADAVDRLSATIFKFSKALALPDEKDSVIRYFITTGSAFRKFVRDRASEFDPKLIELIMSMPFAQFIWVVEISRQADWAGGQIAARAILDATASLVEDAPFWLIHNRTNAIVFNRRTVGDTIGGMRALKLVGMEATAFTRMEQNLRPTQSK